MTWTYNLSDLATSEKDQIRAEVGDTSSTATVTLADEEIARAIATERNMWAAAARCAEMLARRYLAKADVRLGRSLMVQYSTAAEQFQTMAKELRAKAIGTNVPWVGGMVAGDKALYETNDSLVQPIFARDMQENPWVGGYTSDIADANGDPDVDDAEEI